MSRGLGWLQREILETLRTEAHYLGFKGFDVSPIGTYGTRRLLVYLSKKHGRGHKITGEYSRNGDNWAVYESFQASFSRAIHSLVRRGELVAYGHGPSILYVSLPQR